MRPEQNNIAAPVLPGRRHWIGAERDPVMAELTAAGPVLVQFFDFAQLNSVRAVPYTIAWDARYRDSGLTTLGIHSPRYGFTGRREVLAPALERLGICHPVVDDSDYAVWHDYGCEGWPSLFLWGQGGALRWFHFGEGEYAMTEAVIADELASIDSSFEAPEPLEPLRPSDAPDALVVPPTKEVLPGGSVSSAWRSEGDQALELDYEAGGAHISLDGTGRMQASIDASPMQTLEIAGPGLFDLAVHPRHERHSLRVEADPQIEVYSVSFSAGVP